MLPHGTWEYSVHLWRKIKQFKVLQQKANGCIFLKLIPSTSFSVILEIIEISVLGCVWMQKRVVWIYSTTAFWGFFLHSCSILIHVSKGLPLLSSAITYGITNSQETFSKEKRYAYKSQQSDFCTDGYLAIDIFFRPRIRSSLRCYSWHGQLIHE